MSLRILPALLLAILVATPLLEAQAEVQENASTDSAPLANALQAEADSFGRVYLLAPPLPTTGRVASDERSLLEGQGKKRARVFAKNYNLARTFDLPSLESLKPVQTTERFRRQMKLLDPLEKTNRSAFRSTLFIEKAFLRPLAKGWRKIPRAITAPVVNFSRNLSRTTDFLNALAQGNAKRASEVFFSFVLDSTLGFAGLINLSEHLGIPQVEEDFGQTLAHYGIGHGAYFVSFFTGPSSIRDTTGTVVDIVANTFGKQALGPYWNPLDYTLFIATGAGAGVGTGVSVGLGFLRSIDSYSKAVDQIEALEKGSLDFYAATRRFYAYRRALQVLNAENPPAAQNAAQNAPSAPAPSPQDDPFADIAE